MNTVTTSASWGRPLICYHGNANYSYHVLCTATWHGYIVTTTNLGPSGKERLLSILQNCVRVYKRTNEREKGWEGSIYIYIERERGGGGGVCVCVCVCGGGGEGGGAETQIGICVRSEGYLSVWEIEREAQRETAEEKRKRQRREAQRGREGVIAGPNLRLPRPECNHYLTHLTIVSHICVSESGQHWFR